MTDDPRDTPAAWSRAPEPSGASGGHVPPDTSAGVPLWETLDEPRRETPSNTSGAATGVRDDTSPYLGIHREPILPAGRRFETGQRLEPYLRRGGARRVHRTLTRIDPMSVLKVSLIFYAVLLGVWLLLVALLYNFLSSLGIFDVIREIFEGFAVEEVEISLVTVEKWALLIGLTGAVIGSVVNVLLSLLYNAAARFVGGIDVTFMERDY